MHRAPTVRRVIGVPRACAAPRLFAVSECDETATNQESPLSQECSRFLGWPRGAGVSRLARASTMSNVTRVSTLSRVPWVCIVWEARAVQFVKGVSSGWRVYNGRSRQRAYECKECLKCLECLGGLPYNRRFDMDGRRFDNRASQVERTATRSCTPFPPASSKLRCFVGSVEAIIPSQQQALSSFDLCSPKLSIINFPDNKGKKDLSRDSKS